MNDDRIAGDKKISDWQSLLPRLGLDDPVAWKSAHDDYFYRRIELRYLNPINVLQGNDSFQGEGFSIAAIQCSLIEFLESTFQGKNYRYLGRKSPPLGPHEYSGSRDMFTAFLVTRYPFSAVFTPNIAQDFYESVRCGLLHEARTKNGWRIHAESAAGEIICASTKTFFRNGFQRGLKATLVWYERELQSSHALKEALIRKFNALC
jgi:hypothetical protein